MNRVFMIMLLTCVSSFAQTYPKWFLDPGDLPCGPTAAGFSANYYHESSSDSVAFMDACTNLSWQHSTRITGGEAYWSTEAGMFWMGNDFEETMDSSYLSSAIAHSSKLDSCSLEQFTIMLVGESGCDIPESMRALVVCPRTQPSWVENIPQGDGYIYAEGVSSQYFYESSSWESAQKRALFNLARSIRLSMESVQKSNGASGQEIKNEDISVTLRNAQVVCRWMDAGSGLYYVLVRMAAAGAGSGN